MPDISDLQFDRLRAFAEEVNAMTVELNKESDRGAVLVGVAYLDELLTRLFRKKMLLSKKLSEELLEGFGPLSGLSARTKVAYALGWIGPETYL
jgi:DNA-binding MltR family transcriptional regulator